jgi:hypothetical protein
MARDPWDWDKQGQAEAEERERQLRLNRRFQAARPDERGGVLWAEAARRFHGLPEPGQNDRGFVGDEDYPPEWGIWRRDPHHDGEGGESGA